MGICENVLTWKIYNKTCDKSGNSNGGGEIPAGSQRCYILFFTFSPTNLKISVRVDKWKQTESPHSYHLHDLLSVVPSEL